MRVLGLCRYAQVASFGINATCKFGSLGTRLALTFLKTLRLSDALLAHNPVTMQTLSRSANLASIQVGRNLLNNVQADLLQ